MAFKLGKPAAKKAPAKKLAAKKAAAPTKKAAPSFKAPKRRRDEEEEDADAGGPRVGRATTGWGGADELNQGNDFVKSLSFKNEAHRDGSMQYFIVKFLDEEPYANVRIHWLNERKGKKSFVCIGDDCPLCDVGAEAKSEYRFNLAVFTDAEPVLRSYHAGWKIYKKIKALAESRMTAPLPRRTYVLSRTGEKWHEIEYDITKITDEELEEAYPEIYIPTAEEIAELTCYTLADVEKEYSTIEELEEVAAEILEGDA